jgi:hypothetical protein
MVSLYDELGRDLGILKIVNPVIAPIYDEGGLCKGQGGQFAADDIQSDGEVEESGEVYFVKVPCVDNCADVFTKPMVNMITLRSDIASPLDTIRSCFAVSPTLASDVWR